MVIGLIIIMDDPTQHFPAANNASHCCSLLLQWDWNWDALVDTLVWSPVVVIVDVFQKHSPQMSLADDEQPIQAFLPRCPNPSFSKRIRLWALVGREYGLYASGLEHSVERESKLGISVVDQEAYGWYSISQILNILNVHEIPGDIACLLAHPG